MPRYIVPPNTGRVRLMMGLAGTYVVWNGKNGKHEFRICCRTRKKAEEVVRIINEKKHEGFVDVYE